MRVSLTHIFNFVIYLFAEFRDDFLLANYVAGIEPMCRFTDFGTDAIVTGNV